MYSRQEVSMLREEFWTVFGQYMRPVPSATNEKVNWINYKTGVKHIRFKMAAEENASHFIIEFSNPNDSVRSIHYHQFRLLQEEFLKVVPGNWKWEEAIPNGKHTISRITSELDGVNIYRKADWPQLISFFKDRIIALDTFWNNYKDIFIMTA